MEQGTRRLYIRYAGNTLQLAFNPTKTDSEQLYEQVRNACGASQESALKLQDFGGSPVHISPAIPGNSLSNLYQLTVLNSNGMLVDEVNMDLVGLENRIKELEKHLEGNCKEVTPIVNNLKHDVELFRHKLETTKHLSWLNCYKELPPSCRRLQYRRRSDARQKVVREQFLKICESVISEEVRQALRLSSFDCMQWSDEEVLFLLQAMFLDLDLPSLFAIDMTTLRDFLFQVYKNYNEVPFHNFRHSFCVAQMMYAMAWKADLVHKVGHLEVLILLVSCICHDLDHPGYNNIYQINARTELALRYNDISPLENHHCSIAFRILDLQDCNIFSSMTSEDYKIVREGIIRCILATDMGRHNEILAQFREAMAMGFDYNNKTHVNLLSMVLIKVADISNEARPMEVAEPWLDRLLQEFFTQSDAEKEEGLPVTPFMDREKITKPSSQCSFIGFVLLPLFEALGELLTELQGMMVEPVRQALEHYRRLNEAHHKSSSTETAPPSPVKHVSKSSSSYSVRKTSITFSQCADEEGDGMAFDDCLTDGEETTNEVAVSEKTLKFKISTESTSSGRKSYPGSRKGSRDKNASEDYLSPDSSVGQPYQKRELGNRSLSLVDWKHGGGVSSNKQGRSVSAGSPLGLREYPDSDSPSGEAPQGLLRPIGESNSQQQQQPPTVAHQDRSIVKKLKNLGEKLGKSSNVGSTGECSAPQSPACVRSRERGAGNQGEGDERKATTLPKTSKKQKGQQGGGVHQDKRGIWRRLRRSKHNGLADPIATDTDEGSVNNNKRPEDPPESPNRQRWMESLVSSLRGRKNPPREPSKT